MHCKYAGTSEYLTEDFVSKLCESGQSAGKLVNNIKYQPLNDYTPNMLFFVLHSDIA